MKPGDLDLVAPPPKGLWRVGRSPNPLASRRADPADDLASAGNRFDSTTGRFETTYFGTKLECCFGETLSRFRPDTEVLEALGEGGFGPEFMEIGAVPADWRHQRTAVRAEVLGTALFVDIEGERTRATMLAELEKPLLSRFGVKDLGLSVLRGTDRRITRALAEAVYGVAELNTKPKIVGIRYMSRLDPDWEAWAVFIDDSSPVGEIERRQITASMPALLAVAKRYGLTVH